tara:strand:+ start:100 stop:639 length:540 start_codon:yes stop_codon:yes gene_type:complete
MPRKAPKEVIEHRITFGDYERKEFKQTLDSFQFKNNLRTGLIAGGIGLVAYTLYKVIPGMFDFFGGLFETTPEQKAALNSIMNISKGSPNPDYPEWALYGSPRNRDELDMEYERNTKWINARLQKAEETIALYESLPDGFSKNMILKGYVAAKEWRDGGYAKAVESLDLWRAYYYEQLA